MQDHVIFVLSALDYHALLELRTHINCLYPAITFFAVKLKHAGFIGLGGVGERAGIDARGIFQDFAFALGLIERKIFGLLDFADFQSATGTLVEELDEFAIDFIDLATPVGEGHGPTSRRERPCVAACLRERTRCARAALAASTDFAFSISETRAEPTTAASARPPRTETWPGREMPKPTAMGSCVTL